MEDARNNEVTMPDFDQWAHNLIEELLLNCRVAIYDPDDIAQALQQSFKQGVAYGTRPRSYEGVF
jgi:hypothetical protein